VVETVACAKCYDVGVTPEAPADDRRNGSDERGRSDETVRRLRAESRQRIERERRWRRFTSWCALATLSSGFALIALDAYEARRQKTEIEAIARRPPTRILIPIAVMPSNRPG
jgi:hypothetical protein